MLECAGLFHSTVYLCLFVGDVGVRGAVPSTVYLCLFVGDVGVCGAVPASVRGERFVSGD